MERIAHAPIISTPEALFKPKAANFNILSFQPNDVFQFSFFEGAVYKKFDSKEGTIHPELGFYLPMLGTGLFSFDSVKTTNLI